MGVFPDLDAPLVITDDILKQLENKLQLTATEYIIPVSGVKVKEIIDDEEKIKEGPLSVPEQNKSLLMTKLQYEKKKFEESFRSEKNKESEIFFDVRGGNILAKENQRLKIMNLKKDEALKKIIQPNKKDRRLVLINQHGNITFDDGVSINELNDHKEDAKMRRSIDRTLIYSRNNESILDIQELVIPVNTAHKFPKPYSQNKSRFNSNGRNKRFLDPMKQPKINDITLDFVNNSFSWNPSTMKVFNFTLVILPLNQ